MGFIISKLIEKLFIKKGARIFIFGLEGAGKTSILYWFEYGKIVKTIPTIGFNVETFNYKGLDLYNLDGIGQDKKRALWRQYHQNTDGIIFVVDSNDPDTIGYAAEELEMLLAEPELEKCPVLIMANKQDFKGALSPEIIEDKMGMKRYEGRTYHVEGTSVVTGKGLKEALKWLRSVVFKK